MEQLTFYEYQEEADGVRFNWNKWPSSSVECEKIVLRLGCLFTPLKESSEYPTMELQHTPISCCRTTCKAVLNPNCIDDLKSQPKGWICSFCNQRNQLPQQYQHIQNRQEIPEMVYYTIDYPQPKLPLHHPPVFLYIVDSCVDEVEFTALKTSISESLRLLPPNSLVGFITFNHIVYLWELKDIPSLKSYIFCGREDYTPKQLQDWLGLALASQQGPVSGVGGPINRMGAPMTNGHQQPQQPGMNPGFPPQYMRPPGPPGGPPLRPPQMMNNQQMGPPVGAQPNVMRPAGAVQSQVRNVNKFIKPASSIQNVLDNILEQVGKNTWPASGRRPLRAVGAALSLAINILETTYPNSAARIMLFLGGPCTIGPGMIVDDDRKNTIRTHHDIDKDNAKYLKKATEYYTKLATKASNNGHAIDIFSCALDQTGLHEMRCCTSMTNGLLVLGDTFDSNLFKDSFRKIFDKNKKGNLKMAFNAILDVKTSRELKVSGAIGSCISMNKKTAYVADRRDGLGGTSEWKFCSLTPNSTTALYFVVQNSPIVTQAQQMPCGYVQFITQYHGSDGIRHVRVTTVGRYFGSDNYDFDQECATVLLARMACYKSDANEGTGQEILRWIDKSLVRLCQKFGSYHPNSPESFRPREGFELFPRFLFHLRRSQFVQVFNNSPDETSFYRHSLMMEDCGNSLLMIQPCLLAYERYQSTIPVSLDASSIHPTRILLMDTFFQIVIFLGDQIYHMKEQNVQADDHDFKMFLDAPFNDASELMASRFPLPRYVVCDNVSSKGSSQARFLLSRVNPSQTYSSTYGDPNAQPPVLSEDVSFAVFEEHLKKLTVSSVA